MSALTDVFTAIANAIRSKKGVSTTYKPSQMADAISSIQTGITPSGTKSDTYTSNGTYNTDITNYANHNVTVSIPTKSLTTEGGANYHVVHIASNSYTDEYLEAGYYEQNYVLHVPVENKFNYKATSGFTMNGNFKNRYPSFVISINHNGNGGLGNVCIFDSNLSTSKIINNGSLINIPGDSSTLKGAVILSVSLINNYYRFNFSATKTNYDYVDVLIVDIDT